MEFWEKLESIGACRCSIDWVGEMSLEEAWERCEYPEWIAWLIGRVCTPAQIKNALDCVVKYACHHSAVYAWEDEIAASAYAAVSSSRASVVCADISAAMDHTDSVALHNASRTMAVAAAGSSVAVAGAAISISTKNHVTRDVARANVAGILKKHVSIEEIRHGIERCL